MESLDNTGLPRWRPFTWNPDFLATILTTKGCVPHRSRHRVPAEHPRIEAHNSSVDKAHNSSVNKDSNAEAGSLRHKNCCWISLMSSKNKTASSSKQSNTGGMSNDQPISPFWTPLQAAKPIAQNKLQWKPRRVWKLTSTCTQTAQRQTATRRANTQLL